MNVQLERAFVITFVFAVALLASAAQPPPLALALVAAILFGGSTLLRSTRAQR